MSKTKEDSKEINQFFLKQYKSNRNEAFEFLKNIALYSPTDIIRYNMTKLLYKYYPKESSELIDWIISHDDNYNIPIINVDPNRYNFNDLINCAIEKKHNRDDMVEFIKRNKFIYFTLFWKEDYIIDNFKIYCIIPLQCFLFQSKNNNDIVYLFNTYTDPFSFLKSCSLISFSDLYYKTNSSYTVKSIRNIIEKLFKVKLLKIFILDKIIDSDLPHYKITIENYKYVLYLEIV